MTFKDNQFTWTSRVGKIELTNLSGDYTLTGNELKLKATAGLNLKATIKLLDNQRMSFKDNTNLYLVMEYMIGGDFLGLLLREDVLEEDVAK